MAEQAGERWPRVDGVSRTLGYLDSPEQRMRATEDQLIFDNVLRQRDRLEDRIAALVADRVSLQETNERLREALELAYKALGSVNLRCQGGNEAPLIQRAWRETRAVLSRVPGSEAGE